MSAENLRANTRQRVYKDRAYLDKDSLDSSSHPHPSPISSLKPARLRLALLLATLARPQEQQHQTIQDEDRCDCSLLGLGQHRKHASVTKVPTPNSQGRTMYLPALISYTNRPLPVSLSAEPKPTTWLALPSRAQPLPAVKTSKSLARLRRSSSS